MIVDVRNGKFLHLATQRHYWLVFRIHTACISHNLVPHVSQKKNLVPHAGHENKVKAYQLKYQVYADIHK